MCNKSSKGNFPLLHIRGKKWGIGKTQRLIQLHKEIAKLPKIPLWDSDPGVKEFRNAIRFEQTLSGTHPDLMQHHLNQLLDGISEANLPFNLRDLTGIILLTIRQNLLKSSDKFSLRSQNLFRFINYAILESFGWVTAVLISKMSHGVVKKIYHHGCHIMKLKS